MNYTRPILRARLQRLMSSELAWRATPRSNAHEDRDRATVATNLLTSRWEAADIESRVRYAEWLAFSCGVSYLKQFWNPDLGPLTAARVILQHPNPERGGELVGYPVTTDGVPMMDPENGDPLEANDDAFRYRPGDTDTAVRSVFNVRLNPDANGLDPAEGFRWLVDVEVVPIAVVKERYGEKAKNVSTVEGVAALKQHDALIRSITPKDGPHGGGNDLLTGRNGQNLPDKDLTLLTEYWEAASDALPQGRLIIVGGNELLYDGPLPQGFVPYVALYDERKPFDAYGRPSVDDLIGPQKVINKQWTMLLKEMNLGTGQWAMFDVPGLSDQITDLDDAHIRIPMQSALANRRIGDIVQKIAPPQASPDRYRLIEAAQQVMFDIGAYNDVARGQIPSADTSGVAIQLLQEAQAGQLMDAVRSLKQSLVSWGRQTIRMARWGYGEHEERWIPVERPDLGYLVESVTGADLPDPDAIDIDLEGFRPHSQAAFNAEIKEMMGLGAMDARTGLRLMDLGRGVEGAYESEGRHYSRARRENLAIEQGDVQGVVHPPESPLAGAIGLVHPEDGSPYCLPTEDDHALHIEVHQEIALDDTKPYETRQIALFHLNEHRVMLAQQMMAMQPQKPTGQPSEEPNA